MSECQNMYVTIIQINIYVRNVCVWIYYTRGYGIHIGKRLGENIQEMWTVALRFIQFKVDLKWWTLAAFPVRISHKTTWVERPLFGLNCQNNAETFSLSVFYSQMCTQFTEFELYESEMPFIRLCIVCDPTSIIYHLRYFASKVFFRFCFPKKEGIQSSLVYGEWELSMNSEWGKRMEMERLQSTTTPNVKSHKLKIHISCISYGSIQQMHGFV